MVNVFYKAGLRICLLSLILAFGVFMANGQSVVTVKIGTANKEVLILPYNFPLDDSMKDKGEIKANKLNETPTSFKSKLDEVALKTAEAGGNVFQISSMQDHNQGGRYKIWGNAYYTSKYEQVKISALEQKNKKLDNNKYAYLVIYRPDYGFSRNDEMDMDFTINDTVKLDMKANTKYIIQVDKNCKVKVATKNNLVVQSVDVQLGNRYYIRAYVNVPGHPKFIKTGESNVEIGNYKPYFEMIDGVQGDVESSLVNQITISKKLSTL